MADSKHFDSPKVLQFGDKTAGNQAGDGRQCAECEAMLTDALDGTLTADQQERFDAHGSECVPCSQMLADARRGAAWLEMLRTPRPEPPVELLERILAETSGLQGYSNAGRVVSGGVEHAGAAGATYGRSLAFGGVDTVAPDHGVSGAAASYGNMVPFRSRLAAAARRSSFGQIVLQPRFAMTAAMAFFSIALTMNLTGVRLLDLRASDLRPANLKRHFTSANTHVVQYYEGLRVVYELESRVHDFQGASDNDTPAGSQIAPSKPAVQAPSAQPGSGGQKAVPPADRTQPDRKKSATNPGTSRREELIPSRRLVAASRTGKSFDNQIHAHLERVIA